jgi:hypothetical protein
MVDQNAQDRSMQRLVEARRGDLHGRELPRRQHSPERAPAAAPASLPQDAMAGQVTDAVQAMSHLVEETAHGIQAALLTPSVEVREAFGVLMAGATRNTQQMIEGLWRIHTPQDMLGLQQRMLRDWLDTAMAAQALLLRVGLQATDTAYWSPQRQP